MVPKSSGHRIVLRTLNLNEDQLPVVTDNLERVLKACDLPKKANVLEIQALGNSDGNISLYRVKYQDPMDGKTYTTEVRHDSLDKNS